MADPVGSVEGLRAHMLRVHGLDAPDEALEYALRRARSYSGSEAGVYVVAAKWVREAAEEACRHSDAVTCGKAGWLTCLDCGVDIPETTKGAPKDAR